MKLKISNQTVERLALFTMILIFLSVFGMYWLRGVYSAEVGPSVLAADAHGDVYVIAGGKLIVLNAVGRLQESITLKRLGMANDITDMHVLHDGRVLLGSYGYGNIFVCQLPALECEPLLDKNGSRKNIFQDRFQFSVDEQEKFIYVTDTRAHRLERFTLSGEFVGGTQGDSPNFCYPNSLFLMSAGRLALADTNNHRIVVVDTKDFFGDSLSVVQTTQGDYTGRSCTDVSEKLLLGKTERWSTREADYAPSELPLPISHGRDGRIWPTQVVFDQDHEHWWVINTNGNMRNGDVLIFDEHGKALSRVKLLEDNEADPLALLVLQDMVLVADSACMRINRVSHEGMVLGDFGDASLVGLFDGLHAKKKTYGYLYDFSKLLLGLAIVLAVFVVVVQTHKRPH